MWLASWSLTKDIKTMNEGRIRGWFGQNIAGAQQAISAQAWPRMAVTVFYLLGPFFMLIERSPADAWLSLCGLAFIGRCIYRKDWGWTRHFWVRAVFVFWLWCL
ncbi:MAG TPA: hypothetical protein DEQ79_06315, partial [Alphaproteobacteria bacterium]|nr:hypothetical protein [Alphaproteobacteria bacterium]